MSSRLKTSLSIAAIVCLVFLFVPAPAGADDTTTKYDNSVPANSDASSTNGRIPIGGSGKGDSSHTGYGWVIKDDLTYKMWYSGHDGSKWRIYYATSPDGLTWTKLNNDAPDNSDDTGTDGRIPLGATGGDTAGVIGPCVIKDGATYKMWYPGTDGVNYRIYYATSSNGLTWTKSNNVAEANSDTTGTEGRIPLGATGGDTKHVSYPSVIKDDSTYKMWYSGHDGTNWRMYYATSPDGLTWTKLNNAVEAPSDTTGTQGRIPLGATGGDITHAYFPAVIKDGATYRMWYCGYGDGTYRTYHATSTNGLTWTKVDNTVPGNTNTTTTNGRIAPGTTDTGDDTRAMGPCAIRDGADYRIWYTGYEGATNRIYYATQGAPSPVISNNPAANITATSASLIGNLTSTGDAPTEVYCYWGRTNGYTTKGDWATNDYLGTNDLGLLTNNVSDLASGTLYYYRFYATNSVGDDWPDSSELFSTLGAPTVNNDGGAMNVTATSATLRGEVTGGDPNPDVYICWGDNDGGGAGTGDWDYVEDMGVQLGAFSTGISGLLANQTNYYRCFATNSYGGAWAPATTNFTTAPPSLSISDAEVTEGDSGTTNAVFTVTLSATSKVDVTVNFAASNGTAEAGTDYDATNGTLTILAGAVSNTIAVVVRGDSAEEYPSENFYVNLSDPTNATISDGQGVGTIVCDDDQKETKTWTGTGNWTSSGNWTPSGMPGPADDAIIASGAVTLSNSTAIASLIVSNNATLTFKNWTTKLTVISNIMIYGTVTLPSAFTDAQMSNRVWFACSNLLIESSGSINANSKGYAGGAVVGADGNGPGAGISGLNDNYGSGASYGGVGGFYQSYYYEPSAPAYGSTNAPEYAGSGGAYAQGNGGDGGGAVLIEAAGAVTINGTITANGENGGSIYGGGGSGGGIYIACNTFSGTNGAMSATGGGGYSPSMSSCGGGGRIAINYNTSAQASEPMPTVAFSVLGGENTSWKGDLGTLYFSDTLLLPETITYNGQLVMGGLTNWSVNNLTITNSYIRFSQEAFTLVVTNNLEITSSGRLNVGGSPAMAMTNTTFNILDERIVGPSLHVGGNLVLTNSGRLYVQAGVTNASTPDYGALVSVTGDVLVASGSWIYPYSQATNGGSALFRVRNLTIATGGGINANGTGFAGGEKVPVSGHGPGRGRGLSGSFARGAGYGGAGYLADGTYGKTYGSSNAPMDSGSGGGAFWDASYWYRNYPIVYGGGLARVEATGTISVFGTITANGVSGANYTGAGSGGGIYLYCRTFIGSTNGMLRANGTAPSASGNSQSASGGGRIAVWRVYDRSPSSIRAYVDKGVHGYYAGVEGEDGTIVWGWLSVSRTIFIIR